MENDEMHGPYGVYLPFWDWRTNYNEVPMTAEEAVAVVDNLRTLTPDEMEEAQSIAAEVWRDREQHPHHFYLAVEWDPASQTGGVLDQPELFEAYKLWFPDTEGLPARVYPDLPEKMAKAMAYFLEYRDLDALDAALASGA